LTDEYNQPLGRSFVSLFGRALTAAGTGTAQSTEGNLSFTCTLRIDVMNYRQINQLQTELPKPTVPGRFATVLNNQDYGRDNYPTIRQKR
jgi:hypothetical protein